MGIVPDKFEDGSAAFFTNRQPAWHKLGTVTDNALTAEEALRIAYLDTPVTKQPCFAWIGGEYVEVSDKWVTGAPHPKKPEVWRPFGVVGNGYEVVQNIEQFEILDAIRDESNAVYETAGSMNDGRVVFITMKLPETLQFNEQDSVDLYLLAQNSHDGTKAFTLAVTPVRVVCQNTLTLALNSAKRTFSLKHTRNVKHRITEARDALGLTFAYVEEFEMAVQRMIEQPMTDRNFYQFAATYSGLDNDPTGKMAARRERMQEELVKLWHAPTQQVAGRNKWAAYNAVTEYVDWFSGVRCMDGIDKDTARALRTMSRNADTAKQRAWNLLAV